MAIKIDFDKLNTGVGILSTILEKAQEEVALINRDWQASPEYKDHKMELAEKKYKDTVKELTAGLKELVKNETEGTAVKREIDFAEATYYATALNQEISGLNATQLAARYDDILSEGNETRKKEFERLALAQMKNSGERTQADVLQQKIYANMNDAEKDEMDTRKASGLILGNVAVIESQVEMLLDDALNGKKVDSEPLKAIWAQGQSNVERNVLGGPQTV